jgi:hypothetical protein
MPVKNGVFYRKVTDERIFEDGCIKDFQIEFTKKVIG